MYVVDDIPQAAESVAYPLLLHQVSVRHRICDL